MLAQLIYLLYLAIGTIPGKQLARDYAYAPNVDFVGVALLFEYLGCHVEWRAEDVTLRVIEAGEAKVRQLDGQGIGIA